MRSIVPRPVRAALLRGCVRLAALPRLGRPFAALAAWWAGAFRAKQRLADIATFVSPRARLGCPGLVLGRNCYIDDDVVIFGDDGRVTLGDRVMLHRGTIVEVGRGGGVTIGDRTDIEPYCSVDGILSHVRIGRDVMIAARCSFVTTQHVHDDPRTPMNRQGLTSRGDIVIEDDCWLGRGAVVMDGVRIGRGSIIGANAVVTRDVPPLSVAVGVPARVVRRRETPGEPHGTPADHT